MSLFFLPLAFFPLREDNLFSFSQLLNFSESFGNEGWFPSPLSSRDVQGVKAEDHPGRAGGLCSSLPTCPA